MYNINTTDVAIKAAFKRYHEFVCADSNSFAVNIEEYDGDQYAELTGEYFINLLKAQGNG